MRAAEVPLPGSTWRGPNSLIARASPTTRSSASEPWEVNPGNYLVYRFDKRLEADLDLTHGIQRFALRSVPPPARPTASARHRRTEHRFDAGTAPSAPPIDGVLGADVTLLLAPDSLCLRGDDVGIGALLRKTAFSGISISGSSTVRAGDTGPMHGFCWTAPSALIRRRRLPPPTAKARST